MRITTVVLVAVLYALGLLRAPELRADQSDGAPPSAAGVNQPSVEDLKASIVKIVSKAPEGQPRTGTGFVVGVDGELIYIATAAHVIAGDPKPQVTFYFNKRRVVDAEIGELETDNPTAGLGYLIVTDRAVAKQVKALGWSTGTLRGGEEIMAIGFGQGAGEWGVTKGTVSSVSGSDIRIDGRIEEGNSGGPILLDGSVAGMVTSLRQGFGVARSGSVVHSTLRGWDIEMAAPPSVPGAKPPTGDATLPWKQLITSGTAVAVDFDALTGSKGTIRPNGRYRVQFRAGERVWRVSGPKHPDGYQLDVPHPADNVCIPEKYVLCVWGAAFTYNDRGDVLDATTRVGRLRQLSLRDRIVAGESVSVVLDALPSNIGTIKPGGQYAVSFMPIERAWKSTGPMHPQGFQTDVVVPAGSAICSPEEFAMCIWGAAFRFNDAGQLFAEGRSGPVGKVIHN